MYPEHGDAKFADKLMNLKEYAVYKPPELPVFNDTQEYEAQVRQSCYSFDKASYQQFVQHYLSRRSPYRSILLYHGLGVGKTCSAITVAESLLLEHSSYTGPKVIIVSSSALQKSFEEQLFSISRYIAGKTLWDQCAGDLYKKLVHGTKDPISFRKKLLKVIRSRYLFLTYEGVATYLQQNPEVNDKVIIIDEAHNLRQFDNEKKSALAVEKLISEGKGNRLILLSATPMYNEPDEIFWLLNLLLKNDGRTEVSAKLSLYKKNGSKNTTAFSTLSQLASEYISYIRGGSPFTMPIRITPKANGYPTIDNEPDLAIIHDYIVPSPLGSKQVIAKKSLAENSQLLNAYYPSGKTGDKGFSSIFSTVDQQEPIQVVYSKRYVNYFAQERLVDVAPKIGTIIKAITNAEGIVIVYSQFVYGGILPLAVALEHMGCTRFGHRNLCRGIDVNGNNSLLNKQYAVICGDRSIMGSGHIEDIISAVNADGNRHGNNVKVVLITPIAGEGLNFRNVREVHILEPWYHMNKLEQVIGRAARTCSHADLPLEQRNVGVYLHVCTHNVETADINGYKIAARKLNQTLEVERVIRDTALDCDIMQTINYFPRSNFKFSVYMTSSQGRQIVYQFGDDANRRPVCAHAHKSGKVADNTTFRSEVYHGLMSTVRMRIIKKIEAEIARGSRYIQIADILDKLQYDEDITLAALFNVIEQSDTLAFSGNAVVVLNKPEDIKTTEILLGKPDSSGEEDTCVVLPPIPSDYNLAVIMLYMAISSKCWPTLARDILQGKQEEAADILAREGALVTRKELPRAPGTGKYVGYVDIFDTNDFTVVMASGKIASEAELRQIKSARAEITPQSREVYGMIFPNRFSKDKSVATNQLKLFVPGPNTRGAMCAPKKVTELQSILYSVTGRQEPSKNRDGLCFTISYELSKVNRLFTYPLWKPKRT